MLLSIFFFSILMSVRAMPNRLILNQHDISLIDQQISTIKNFDPLLLKAHPDADLTTLELVSKYGYDGELHKVTTCDDYILELHRITGRTNAERTNSSNSRAQKPVAFLMHGLLCSSAGWILVGPEKALAYILADAGYDVWLGNARGSMYSRKHKSLSVLDKEYWNFSFHEIGTIDLPAMIDYTLKTTGQKRLFYLGHSQGTTTFFVMASQLPAYQNKIEAMFAMAPVAYLGRMTSPVLNFLARFTDSLEILMELIGLYEFEPTGKGMKIFQDLVCADGSITQPLCSNLIFLITGFDNDLFNSTLLPIVLGHLPAGASTKQMIHYMQLFNTRSILNLSGKFRQYDYGWVENRKKYGSINPPLYDLSKISVPVSLHYGSNDWLAHVKDVDKLYKELGNPYGKFRVPHDSFNHLDFMLANNVKTLLYDKILSIMAQFRK
ncbi:lipase 3-like [Nylanderia fulva]|uniref:lipase 3-like n=1 Tax=Nylanderia fulva TaxID=613905 RepID=UPI0010FB331C|nr:lipase 3-like [Nylanderia fulva]